MAVNVYGLPMSTCTTRVLTCLNEKGVDFNLLPVNLTTGEHKQPPFTDKNPFGQIPVLEDGDLTLFESRAIAVYIAEKYKDMGNDLIRHNDIKESALVKVWVEVEAHQFHPVVSPIIYNVLIAPLYGKPADQAVIDTNVEKLGKVFDIYEAKLATTKYLAGDFYSLADLNHLPYIHYLMKTQFTSLVESRPHVKAWWEDISSRPAFKSVSEAMTFG